VGSGSLFGAGNKTSFGKWAKNIITGQWFQYSVGHHEMLHRKLNFNYGQYCMFYDLWMGTFLEYEGPMSAPGLQAKKEQKMKAMKGERL